MQRAAAEAQALRRQRDEAEAARQQAEAARQQAEARCAELGAAASSAAAADGAGRAAAAKRAESLERRVSELSAQLGEVRTAPHATAAARRRPRTHADTHCRRAPWLRSLSRPCRASGRSAAMARGRPTACSRRKEELLETSIDAFHAMHMPQPPHPS